MQVQDPDSAAAKILAVEPTLKVNFSRANGALHRAPNDKVTPQPQQHNLFEESA
jgi:hypothetical protein